jgi:hypothetical protein
MSDHTSVAVSVIPSCDVNPDHGAAYADAKILRPAPGPWGNFCKSCFDSFGCRLGLGFGQALMLPVMTECGKRADAYDAPGELTINGHYHYRDGACDTEPPYSMGGPA